MTDIKHHISDDYLIGYAAGALPRAFELVVATHVSLSHDARARLSTFEAIGGVMLSDLDDAEVGDDSLAQTMARISATAPSPRRPAPPARGIFPAPLRDVVGGDLDAVKWRSIGMGCKQSLLNESADGTARLLYIPAGAAMPRHSHRGTEMTLVLKGAYRDETDRFGRGDIEIGDEDMHHSPVAEMGEDCICLIATDARLKFDGLLPRLAQSFLRI